MVMIITTTHKLNEDDRRCRLQILHNEVLQAEQDEELHHHEPEQILPTKS